MSVSAVLTSSILIAGVLGTVSCNKPEQPKTNSQASAVIFDDRLMGSWSLDRAKTIAASKLAAEEAGTGSAAKRLALNDYLENRATPEDAAKIRDLIQEGTSPEEIMAMVAALEAGGSAEELADKIVAQIDDLDLALLVSFDGKQFRTSEGDRTWNYSVSEAEHSSGEAILKLQGADNPWTMRISVVPETLTIHADEEFFLNLGTPPDEISRLPVPMVFVFQRDPARARQGEQVGDAKRD
jgi:hypothetical protein